MLLKMSNESENLVLLGLEGENDIIETLSRRLGYDKKIIESRTRRQEIVKARDLIVYLLREYGDLSYPAIGRLLGGRDHTTMIHAYKKTERNIKAHPELKIELGDLIREVGSIKERKFQVERDLIPKILASVEVDKAGKTHLIFRKILDRNLKILELWREGLTLQDISSVFNITRQRIQQIVGKTIKQMAINESVSRGIVMDSDLLIEEEFKKRRILQKSKKEKTSPPKKEKRWSVYYASCRSCGTTAIPHVRRGLCEQCIGQFRATRREEIIKYEGNKCKSCGILRHEAIAEYGRDFYITKDKMVLCRKCFLKQTGKKLGEYKTYGWSRYYPQCKSCGTTSIPHMKKGLCENCSGLLTSGQREEIIKKHLEKCDDCGIGRVEARRKFGRDLYITKIGKILCGKCFQKYSSNAVSLKKNKRDFG